MKRFPKSPVARKAAVLFATLGCAAALTVTVSVSTHTEGPKPDHSTTVLAGGGDPDEWNSTG
ncbi:hypothetical protein [Streptomyces humi]|uniref:hypothetical protein n=1 Tax=Streptomyces humi TaxID=1428620 RepID=UPI0006288EA9|nr:hypothetical protein [Streptomyces humi]